MSWSVLQSASTAMSFGTAIETAPATYGSNCSSGSVLIAYVYVSITGSSSVMSSVKDGAGNSFTKVAEVINTTSAHQCDVSVWALATPAGDVGAKPAITATPTALSTYAGGLIIQEVSGIQATLDGTAGTSTGNASPTGTPSYSSTASNEYLISFYGTGDANGQTITGPGGWTTDAHSILTNSSTGGGGPAGVAYKNSTNGAETDAWTDSLGAGADQWGLIVAAFKLSSSGPAVGPPLGKQNIPNFPVIIPVLSGLRGAGRSR